jgi:hypothetical protein
MSEGKGQGATVFSRENALLALAAAVLGLAGAAVFAAYRAVSLDGESTGGRMTEFASNVAWPGVLIFVAVAAVVWFGWKANLD